MPITRKLGESDITVPILYTLLNAGGCLDTSSLIDAINKLLDPSGQNKAPLLNRNDYKIDQIIRNVVSHRNVPHNIIALGYVGYDEYNSNLYLTNEGKKYLWRYMKNIFCNQLN